jgi:hypothetical protein
VSDELHQSEHNRLRNEIRRLRLAASDMEQIADAAQTLLKIHLSAGAERVMQTGLVVTYVRAFKSPSGIGILKESEWAPSEPRDRALHDRLVNLRDKLFAHTDKTGLRDVVDTSALLGLEGGPTYAETWVPFSTEGIAQIGQVAEAQRDRFTAAADEREFLLGRDRPDPDSEGWNV